MDWNQSTMYEQRVRFILEVQQRTFSFAESCRRYSISRVKSRVVCKSERKLLDASVRLPWRPPSVREA